MNSATLHGSAVYTNSITASNEQTKAESRQGVVLLLGAAQWTDMSIQTAAVLPTLRKRCETCRGFSESGDTCEVAGFRQGSTEFFRLLGYLRGVRWFKSDVSGLNICPILKGQAIHVTLKDEER
jgi:hypothetical protein